MAVNGKVGQRHRRQDRAEQLSALADKIVDLQGWRRQAEGLVQTHAAVGMPAMAATEPARRGQSSKWLTGNFPDVEAKVERAPATRKIEHADRLDQTGARSAEPVRHLAGKSSPGRILIENVESLRRGKRVAEPGSTNEELENANRSLQTPFDFSVDETMRQSRLLSDGGALTADLRSPELKVESGTAREEIVRWENENHSLQTSLGLLISENSRLNRCFSESAAAAAEKRIAELEGELGSVRQALLLRLDDNRLAKASLDVANRARSQLERKQAALLAAEAELDKLAVAVNEANEKQRTEINTLHNHVQAVSARAVTAEKRIAELESELGSLRQALVSREDENRPLKESLIVADKAPELESGKIALVAAEVEFNELTFAVIETDEKQRSEINTPRYPLVSSGRCTRGKVAGGGAAELARAVDPCSTAGRGVADQVILPGAANKKLESLASSWLRRLGLEQYEMTFRNNEIDATVLPNLTAEDLKDLGVGPIGHRRKMLDAIAALRASAETAQ